MFLRNVIETALCVAILLDVIVSTDARIAIVVTMRSHVLLVPGCTMYVDDHRSALSCCNPT